MARGRKSSLRILHLVPVYRDTARQRFRGMLRLHVFLGAAAEVIRRRRVASDVHFIPTPRQ
jgi:hypothetical protein